MYRNILSDVLNAKVENNSDIASENGGNEKRDARETAIDDRVAQRDYLLSDNYVWGIHHQ